MSRRTPVLIALSLWAILMMALATTPPNDAVAEPEPVARALPVRDEPKLEAQGQSLAVIFKEAVERHEAEKLWAWAAAVAENERRAAAEAARLEAERQERERAEAAAAEAARQAAVAPATTTLNASGGCATNPDAGGCWDQLAQCESGGNWAINTGNGYYGGLQFALSSWRGVGGTGYPHEHSRETQIEMGRRLWQQGGWAHWPACTSKFGWR